MREGRGQQQCILPYCPPCGFCKTCGSPGHLLSHQPPKTLPPNPDLAQREIFAADSMTLTGQNLFQTVRLLSTLALALLIKRQQRNYSIKILRFHWISMDVKILVSKTMHIFDKGIWLLACLLRRPGLSTAQGCAASMSCCCNHINHKGEKITVLINHL